MTTIGAYGLALTGPIAPPTSSALFAPVHADSQQVTLRWEHHDGGEPDDRGIRDDDAVLRLLEGHLRIDRASATVTFHQERAPDEHFLAHPGLSPVGATFARWGRREAFHAGSVLVDGEAWMVLGERTAGKSTLLANLAWRGHTVMADDLSVIVDGHVLAGPRVVDLRRPPPDDSPLETVLLDTESRLRHRIVLPPAPPRAPLGGWVVLRADEERVVRTVPPTERLEALAALRTLKLASRVPRLFLDVVARPAIEFHRPREDPAAATVDRFLEAVARAADGATGAVGSGPGRSAGGAST